MTQTLEIDRKTEVKFPEDPVVSFIVPVYDLPPMVLKRCLLSLSDQDYTAMEVIIVLDGPNPELKRVIEPFLTSNFKLLEIEHGGACKARNEGFKVSKGEIVSFFNSDYIAKPGMVRYWVKKLQGNPDCGFAYGGYEYNSSNRSYYPSKGFSEYELTSANYIDCGFPLWRKNVVEWDVDCKSLQDWDFWIRVIREKKAKGLYLDNYLSFIAEPPRPKGLSDDSHSNWIDRVRYVKTKNGIGKRDILVTSLGAKNHGLEVAKLLNADFRDDTIYKPCDYKALYMIGFYMRPDEPGLNEHARILAHFKDKYPKTKRIVHFVGASIYWLRKFPYDSLKYLSGALRESCDEILTETPQDHDDLLQFGIKSKVVPIPSYTEGWEVKPLPKEFNVSLYLVEPGRGLGESDFDKYCYEQTLSIVRGMPDVKFTGYGYGGEEIDYPNLNVKGVIPRDKWKDYVYENSCLLRLVRHDTLPMAACEFIMAGRDVITNYPMPYATLIDTKGRSKLNEWDHFNEGFNVYNWPETKARIIRTIREIKKKSEAMKKGADFYKKELDKETYIKRMGELCGA